MTVVGVLFLVWWCPSAGFGGLGNAPNQVVGYLRTPTHPTAQANQSTHRSERDGGGDGGLEAEVFPGGDVLQVLSHHALCVCVDRRVVYVSF